MGEPTSDLESWLAASYDRAYRTAYLIVHDRADAEEAVQEAFLRVWRFRDALPEGDGMRPWLYRVIVNSSISMLRHDRPRREHAAGADGIDETPGREPSPEVSALDAEAASTVLAALADLPEHLRIPVVLRYWSGLSEREIATAVRRRPGTVKSRLHEARRRLGEDRRLATYRPELAGGMP